MMMRFCTFASFAAFLICLSLDFLDAATIRGSTENDLLTNIIAEDNNVKNIRILSHSWSNYHWARTSDQFTLQVVNSTTSEWGNSFTKALIDWSTSLKLDLSLDYADLNFNRTTCPQILGKIRVCNFDYSNTGWLGIAQISINSLGHIRWGTTKLNDYFFKQARYNTTAWRSLVMCQEIGHDFGLGHQDENRSNANLGSCMDYASYPAGTVGNTLSNEQPNQHDYDQLNTIYGGHLDTSTTIAAVTSASIPSNNGNGNNGKGKSNNEFSGTPGENGWGKGNGNKEFPGEGPSAWGKLVANSKGSSKYIKEEADGTSIVTEVHWAEGENPNGDGNIDHDGHR